jgi:hypothetical protein
MPSQAGNIQRCLDALKIVADLWPIAPHPSRAGCDILEPNGNGRKRFNGFPCLAHNIASRRSPVPNAQSGWQRTLKPPIVAYVRGFFLLG